MTFVDTGAPGVVEALGILAAGVVYSAKTIYELVRQRNGNGKSTLVCMAPSMPERLAPILDRQTEVLDNQTTVLRDMSTKLTQLCTIMDERRPSRKGR